MECQAVAIDIFCCVNTQLLLLGVGHTRYSTFGTSDETHCQPFLKEMIHGWFAVAHNGQLVNAFKLKKEVHMYKKIYTNLCTWYQQVIKLCSFK